mgnify:CR=1 FL=1
MSVNDAYVSINIVANDANSTYRGSIHWSAVCAVKLTIQWNYGSGTQNNVYAYKMGNVVMLSGQFIPSAQVPNGTNWLKNFPKPVQTVWVMTERPLSEKAYHCRINVNGYLINDTVFNQNENITLYAPYICQ